MMAAWARKALFQTLQGLRDAHLTLVAPDGVLHSFGDAKSDLRATIRVHNEQFFVRAIFGGDDGAGEGVVGDVVDRRDLAVDPRVVGIPQGQTPDGIVDRHAELADLSTHYAGRPSPLYFAERLTAHLGGAKIYFKRDELNHTGAHKINNVLGQILGCYLVCASSSGLALIDQHAAHVEDRDGRGFGASFWGQSMAFPGAIFGANLINKIR